MEKWKNEWKGYRCSYRTVMLRQLLLSIPTIIGKGGGGTFEEDKSLAIRAAEKSMLPIRSRLYIWLSE